MCGEQQIISFFFNRLSGSPPRVRGTELLTIWPGGEYGITPACAGNSGIVRLCSAGVGDHPRVCGEQNAFALVTRPLTGSPPRVRGTAEAVYEDWKAFRITPACAGNRPAPLPRGPAGRITPACAGNRSWNSRERIIKKDHPRVCGEQLCLVIVTRKKEGSPPRVRGTAYLG